MLRLAENPGTFSSGQVCSQCCGTMILDDFVDVNMVYDWNLGFGFRCVDCGAVCDPLGTERLIFS